MQMADIFSNSWVWLVVSLAGFGLCTFLPLWVKDDRVRKMVYWIILIPASLVLMLYVYPFGLEVFRRLGTGGG